MSVSGTVSDTIDSKPSAKSDDLPPMLKHIMSVEDIERQQTSTQESRDDKGQVTLTTGLPDITQPPPNHPAYRGVSPQTYQHQARKSPMEETAGSDMHRQKGKKDKIDTGQSKSASKGVPGPVFATEIVSGNLMPLLGSNSSIASIISSQASSNPPIPSAQKSSPEAVSGNRVSPRGDSNTGAMGKAESHPPVKTGPLLTPADLLQSSLSLSSSSSVNTTFTQEQVSESFKNNKIIAV